MGAFVVGGFGPGLAQPGHGAKAAGLADFQSAVLGGLGNGGFENACCLVPGDFADNIEQANVIAVRARGHTVAHGLHPLADIGPRDGDAVNLPNSF